MKNNLRTHQFCIETAAKNIYEKALKQYFKINADKNTRLSLEIQIEGLKTFLDRVDTQSLRSSYPELDKGGNTDVVVKIDAMSREITLAFCGKKNSSTSKIIFREEYIKFAAWP